MAKSNGNLFNLQIKPFSGDANYTNHFFRQFTFLANSKKLSDSEAILFLPNYLEGDAHNFYFQNHAVQNSNNLEEVVKIFTDFFSPLVQPYSLKDYENLRFLEGESIKSFTLRLDSICQKVYSDLPTEAIESIKNKKFQMLMPDLIRMKLLELDSKSYSENVATATKYFQVVQQNQAINSNNKEIHQVNSINSSNLTVSTLKPILSHSNDFTLQNLQIPTSHQSNIAPNELCCSIEPSTSQYSQKQTESHNQKVNSKEIETPPSENINFIQVTEQINELKKQLQNLSANQNKEIVEEDKMSVHSQNLHQNNVQSQNLHQNKSNKRNRFHPKYRNKPYNQNSNRNRRSPCQICNKTNHIAKDCYSYVNLQRSNSQQAQPQRNRNYNQQKNFRRDLL